MADFADNAQDINEAHLDQALTQALERARKPVTFSGRCMCCGDPVEQRRFCDSACRESYELRQRRARS